MDEIRDVEAETLKTLVYARAVAAYDERETEFPVMQGLIRFSRATSSGLHLDRDGLIAWARERFHVELSTEDLKHKQRDEIQAVLVSHSQAFQKQAGAALQTAKSKIEKLFDGAAPGQTVATATGGNGSLDSLSSWLHDTLHVELPPQEISGLDRDALELKVVGAVEDTFHPEMRRMERSLLLEIVDTAWKDHLLVMDRLRSSVGLVSYAQVDPKVEYKREGMKLFEQMWTAIGERVTDLVYRMEQLDEGFVGSTWVETSARHDAAPGTSDIANQQQAAINASQGDMKIEPIRNRGERIGRNDPCPCGSGKKYKQCCMRRSDVA